MHLVYGNLGLYSKTILSSSARGPTLDVRSEVDPLAERVNYLYM